MSQAHQLGGEATAYNAWKAREPHVQELKAEYDIGQKPLRAIFDGTQFIAHVKASAVKFTRWGDLEVMFVVPAAFKDQALKIAEAFDLPLSVDIQIWHPYEDA